MLFAAFSTTEILILAGVGVFVVALLVVTVFFHITLMRAIQACAPRNRAMAPGLVWLNFVPCLNLVWQFVNVIQVGNSLQAEYRDRGMRSSDESFGKTLGLSYIILNYVASGINVVGRTIAQKSDEPTLMIGLAALVLVLGLVQLVLWIMYWVKIAAFTRELNEGGGRRRYDDEDDDYDRRRRYDDRDDERVDDRRRYDRDDHD
jgi:hypothetical protein